MLSGVVESLIDSKTLKVCVVSVFRHHVYGKVMSVKKSILCHCNREGVRVGDVVNLVQSRKISKRKHFVVL